MMDHSIMRDFLFRVQNDGTMDIIHKPCRVLMMDRKGNTLNPINLSEAYEAAEEHLMNLCPGNHPSE